MSASAAGRRRADSKNTRVASMAARSASALRRAAARPGRKPAKTNRSVGRPETTSAASGADGPGTTVTPWPAAMQARTSL